MNLRLIQRLPQRSVFTMRGVWSCGAWILLAGVLLTMGGCVAPAPENEGGELYHHNWWNYYARGTYLFRQGRTEEAQADFQRCLGLIPGAKFGNARDMWRARTYGLHFVEGYFPNRELGICLLERNDISQAVHFLETSLRQEPSGRAKHYFNLALQKQMSVRFPHHSYRSSRATGLFSHGAARVNSEGQRSATGASVF